MANYLDLTFNFQWCAFVELPYKDNEHLKV